MAPPTPSASMPLTHRLLELAKTLQFAWFLGHVVTLLCIGRYLLSCLTLNYASKWALFSYRTTFIATAITYGIVVFKAKFRRRTLGEVGIVELLSEENVHYLAVALVWLFSPQFALATLPFGVYSVFHVLTYVRSNLIPTIQPAAPAAAPAAGSAQPKPMLQNVADGIGSFVKTYYDQSMGLVAALEIGLWLRILLSALIFTKGSWILIALYTVFMRVRFAQSSFVQGQFSQLTARGDSLVGGQGIPPAARQVWDGVKGAAGQFRDATDLGARIKGPAPQKKTS